MRDPGPILRVVPRYLFNPIPSTRPGYLSVGENVPAIYPPSRFASRPEGPPPINGAASLSAELESRSFNMHARDRNRRANVHVNVFVTGISDVRTKVTRSTHSVSEPSLFPAGSKYLLRACV